MTRVLAADPGKTGTLALIDTDVWTISLLDMPQKPGTGGKITVSPAGVARAVDAARPDHTIIEDVTSSPQMGVTSAFSFGRSLGILEGACAACSMLTKVRPQVWKSATKTPRDKNDARRRAMQLMPAAYDWFTRAEDDGRAEAALLALYGVIMMLKTAPPRPLTLAPFTS